MNRVELSFGGMYYAQPLLLVVNRIDGRTWSMLLNPEQANGYLLSLDIDATTRVVEPN